MSVVWKSCGEKGEARTNLFSVKTVWQIFGGEIDPHFSVAKFSFYG